KPHDESSSQVPKGSGNLNPTASSSNPLAEQMETLTVKSPNPTVSSPVPTACLNDSPKPSSEKTDPALLHFCLFSCFLSQVEPKKVSDALQDLSWVEAMQKEFL
nr:hypothetical protein [Tanacetum cinerariifolium]